MHYKFTVATILSLIALICFVLMVLGIVGLVDLQAFAIGSEMGVRILAYIAVGCLLLVASLYFND